MIAEGPAVLTLMCVEAALNRCPICKVLWAVEDPFSGYKDFQGGFEELERIMVWGR